MLIVGILDVIRRVTNTEGGFRSECWWDTQIGGFYFFWPSLSSRQEGIVVLKWQSHLLLDVKLEDFKLCSS
jgi:hypothetical protein